MNSLWLLMISYYLLSLSVPLPLKLQACLDLHSGFVRAQIAALYAKPYLDLAPNFHHQIQTASSSLTTHLRDHRSATLASPLLLECLLHPATAACPQYVSYPFQRGNYHRQVFIENEWPLSQQSWNVQGNHLRCLYLTRYSTAPLHL